MMFVPYADFDPFIEWDAACNRDFHGSISGWMERSEEPSRPIGFRIKESEAAPPVTGGVIDWNY